MESIRSYKQLVDVLKTANERKRVVLVCPSDEHSQYVVERCLKEELADFILVVETKFLERAENMCRIAPGHVEIIEVESPEEASAKGVSLIHEGKGDVLMKGLVSTDVILRAVLNKEYGLLPKGRVMSHLTVAETPFYHKLLFFSDVAVIPHPTLDQFDAMVRYDVEICRKLGIMKPRVALIHFTEKVNPKFQHTLDYEELKKRAAEGAYGDVILDGPMDVKSACDLDSCKDKGIDTPIAGQADVVIFPNIESGNTFYKTMSLFGKSVNAGILCGTTVPVIITSRADTGLSKYYSLALACKVS